MIGIERGGLGNKKTSGDNPRDSIVKIGQTTWKSPIENHQLTQVWKIYEWLK